MGIFKSDLFRSFAVGFGLGALVLCLAFGRDEMTHLAGGMVRSAIAAPAR